MKKDFVSKDSSYFEIREKEHLLAIHTNVDHFGHGVNFFTEKNLALQVGVLKHTKSTSIIPHIHQKVERKFDQTNEVLIILKGKLKANFYFKEKLVGSRVCCVGDILLLIDGGHGFEILEEVCVVEAKLGPYLEENDKIRFSS